MQEIQIDEEHNRKLDLAQQLRVAVKKKLENIIFDTMSHPEEVPENFDECKELARTWNFWDLIEGFDLIDSEIGRIQRQRTIQRRKNKWE